MAARETSRALVRTRSWAADLLGAARWDSLFWSAVERVTSTAERWLAPEYRQRIEQVHAQRNEFGVDPFGFDPEVARHAMLFALLLHRYYFRSEVIGIHRVPAGRVLLVANHSGQLPIDAVCIAASMLADAQPPRFVRSMVEKWTQTLPFVSQLFARCGQVVGVPENCRKLLGQGESILVFPEGARGVTKTFSHRYQLEEFGSGFMRLALETETPIVPIAVIGGEEQYVSVYDFKPLARVFGMPAFPVIPSMLIPILGMLPAPTKYRLYFGDPLSFSGDADDEDGAIEEKVGIVRSTIQSMINRGLKERKAIFW